MKITLPSTAKEIDVHCTLYTGTAWGKFQHYKGKNFELLQAFGTVKIRNVGEVRIYEYNGCLGREIQDHWIRPTSYLGAWSLLVSCPGACSLPGSYLGACCLLCAYAPYNSTPSNGDPRADELQRLLYRLRSSKPALLKGTVAWNGFLS